jgi:hypothetical protein
MNGNEAAEHAFAVCALLQERELTEVEAFAVVATALANLLTIIPQKPLTPAQLDAALAQLNESVRQQVAAVQQAMATTK